ncbi:hypothetical protein K8F61_07415 [Microbacterium resistens]|uniref:ATPase BadF/BadG/BcrA/BcrD type domain-containing protein n=1 Tax=Microbacterium resistens TaxID=156977 RepID=A0ABY3RZE2_9MICO|nr:BadF/BadG/BcrA/BcrD ATPase family protein [Microbacterium resistens]UGS27982.1 hypothetical protein K8F61_07415 [Microbacterium resistens]
MSHDALVLGVDAGGTSTRAVLATPRGECLGYGVGGGGNPISVGAEASARAVLDAVHGALAVAGRRAGDVSVIVAAMAGYTSGGGGERLRGLLAEHGFAGRLEFRSDLLALYFSGTAAPAGYALVSGTGACVIRVEDGDVAAAADGLGWLLGDRGSGFWIGHRVARAAAADLDGGGPPTALTDAVLTACGIERGGTTVEGRPGELSRLVETLYAQRPVELSRFAPLAFDHEDDETARGILREAGAALAATLEVVRTGPGPIVVGGSVLSRPGVLRDEFIRRASRSGEALEILRVGDGAAGAAYLALREAGDEPDASALAALTATLARFR